MYLSVVIPAYNEAARIHATLVQLQAYLNRRRYSSELIVVDDGSTDGTSDLVRRHFPNVALLTHTPNRGKGYAVRQGMGVARGAFRMFYDADGSTPIGELEKMWPLFDAGAELVIGSRSLPQSEVLAHQAWYRESMGRVFNRIERALGLTRFPDTQCGFKAFTARAADVIFPRQNIDGFSFDAEILWIAQRHALRIEQVPVQWRNEPDSRVRLVSDSVRMLRDLIRIRQNERAGRYR